MSDAVIPDAALAELARLCEAATPGRSRPVRHEHDDGEIEYWVGFGPPHERGGWDADSSMMGFADAAFTAALGPDTVRALILELAARRAADAGRGEP